MYEKEEKGFVLTDIILQILFFVLFIVALVWLFPTKGFVNNLKKQISGHSADYQVLSNRIFNENLLDMKVAAENYYTTPRLPKNTGDKVSMTLGEMMNKKLVLPIQDKNGNSCDTEKSYVEIKKQADEYELKVILNCSDKEDYLIVHLGCYQYCENDICEKTDDSTVRTSTNTNTSTTGTTIVERPVTVERPVINNNITINNDCVDCVEGPTRTEPLYYCQYVNGKYYGKNGNLVDSTIYQKECIKEPTPTYYCQYVNGKYYGKNGNIVDSTTYQKECIKEPTPTYYCQYVNGKYYGKNGNIVSETTYQAECIKNPEPVKNLYYEYRTKTLKTNEIPTRMCTYHPIEEKSEDYYSLNLTGTSVNDISRYPYAISLPAGAKNVQISSISYGQETFDLDTWKWLKLRKYIYNYEHDNANTSAKDMITTSMIRSSALSRRHFSDVRVLNTKTVSYSNYVEYRIDYRARFNRSTILNDRYLSTYNDSNVGRVYYVPIRFRLTYDIASSKTKTKPCSELTTTENAEVVRRYTEYHTENSYEYGPRRWTTNPNLSGVEYTGNREWR